MSSSSESSMPIPIAHATSHPIPTAAILSLGPFRTSTTPTTSPYCRSLIYEKPNEEAHCKAPWPSRNAFPLRHFKPPHPPPPQYHSWAALLDVAQVELGICAKAEAYDRLHPAQQPPSSPTPSIPSVGDKQHHHRSSSHLQCHSPTLSRS